MSFRFSLRQATHLLVASATVATLSGCAMGDIALSGPDNSPVTAAVHMTGIVHGGQQPVTGSNIQLYVAGATGYGSLATALIGSGGVGSITVTNAGAGYTSSPTISFTGGGGSGAAATASLGSGANAGKVSILLTSPGSGYTSNPTVVITPANGNTPSTPATATATAVPTGGIVTDASGNFSITGDYTCPNANAFVYITATNGNPGLTAGTSNNAIKLVAPLGPCGNLSATTQVFINEVTTAAMAFAMGQYFTTSYGGTSIDSFGGPTSAQGQLGFTNAYATTANLVNTVSGNAVVTNVLGTAATGTVTATPDSAKLYSIANILAACVNTVNNQSTNCQTLFKGVTPTYAPGSTTVAATQASDVLQAAVYMSLNPTLNNANGSSTNMTNVYGLQAATAAPYTGAPYTGLIAQPTDWTIGIEYGSATKDSAGLYPLSEPYYFAVDGSGNVWVGNYTTANFNLEELSPTGAPLYDSGNILTMTTTYSVVVDPSNNVWITDSGASTVHEYSASAGSMSSIAVANIPYSLASDASGNIFVLEGAAGEIDTIKTGATTSSVGLTGLSTLLKYSQVALDSNLNLWLSTDAAANGIVEVPYNTTTNKYSTSPTTYNPSVLAIAEGIAIDSSNNLWLANVSSTAPTLAQILAATPTSGNSYSDAGVTKGADGLAIDGGGNIWVPNYSTTTNGIYEVSAAGVELSPTTGYAHTVYDSKWAAVDPSGNVWVGGGNNYTYAQCLLELVGAAVPVITPIASGLPTTAGGTNKLGTRP